jgi:excinuclease ABC subunit A
LGNGSAGAGGARNGNGRASTSGAASAGKASLPKIEAASMPVPPTPTNPVSMADLAPAQCIRVRGAREHNLKNIDVNIPRDRLVVITGLSGSGKSSLAFDTIFAEGQRKYMESLSAYARQFLDQLKKPDVDDIEGLPPTIAIEQRSGVANPRSTVATTTEIYDYLRLLFARCGHPTCWSPTEVKKDGTVLARCGRPISATSATQIIDAVMGLGGLGGAETRLMVLAPIVRAKKGFHKDVLEDMQAKGWGRVRVSPGGKDAKVLDIRDVLKKGGENPLGLGRYEKHSIDVVVDRIALKPDARQRLAEAIEGALRLAEGTVVISVEESAEKWKDHVYSEKFACPEHPECALEELSPRLFSFNSPHGACAECHGLGVIMEFDEDLVIPDRSKSLAEGAIKPFKVPPPMGRYFRKLIRKFCEAFRVDPNQSVGTLPAATLQILLKGSTPDDVKKHKAQFGGVGKALREWYERTESSFIREWLGQYMHEAACPSCNGDRLRIEALHVQLSSLHAADTNKADSPTVIGRERSDGRMLNIAELSRLTINDAADFIRDVTLSAEHRVIAEPILKELLGRMGFLTSVGLDYLSLDRKTGTLSGGEAQRIRLATQVGSKLVGACYVLDEPTIGLHQRDNARLITTLRHLADTGGGGNTVIVVEHDEDMIRAADHVLDVGPGPGVHGGKIVAQGTVPEIIAEPGSLTGQYLSGIKRIETPGPGQRRPVDRKNIITIKGATENNLKHIDVSFPLGLGTPALRAGSKSQMPGSESRGTQAGAFVCVTGVSGSGKSTLVNDILLNAAKKDLHASRVRPGAHDKIVGLDKIDRVIEVDQSPIGRTPRSNPATYTGIFDEIRRIFSTTKEAKIRGYKPGRFSFNVSGKNGGGRCEACEGQGLKKIEMHFLPDVYVSCEVCGGKRYNRETLEVHYRGKSIADVLAMTIEEACGFFENHPRIGRFVGCLRDVGLGYVELGQPSTQLSGGEAQRVKLATELGKIGGAMAAKQKDGDEDGGDEGDDGEVPAKSVRHSTLSSVRTLYILDEPTTGLHFDDVHRLINVLNRLADSGHALVVIEHNLDVIKCADWIIDLGPEGGDKGGHIIAEGTPEEIMNTPGSYTGRFLRMHVEAERNRRG